jgi:exodeoxyribonuclease-3
MVTRGGSAGAASRFVHPLGWYFAGKYRFMRIVTWNVNGMRAALRKGFGDVLAQLAPDVVLLQEIRCLPEQLPDGWQTPHGWHVVWHPAQRKGYAGTAIWSRWPMTQVRRGLDSQDADPEGRVLTAQIQGLKIGSIYLPSGSASPASQASKERWMERFLPWARKLARSRKPVVLGGDLNIAHTERDIFYAKGNEKNSGFLPHERAWFGELLDSGWSDFVRQQFGDQDGPYSWWSNRGNARELDRGWRIDYLLGNRPASRVWCDASIYRSGGLTVSDHAPVVANLEQG